MELTKKINKNIFREYDIRGIAEEDISDDVAYTIGRSFGSILISSKIRKCMIGHDNRVSSPRISEALIRGILNSGVDVIDLGICTTPMYYYACIDKNIKAGIMVTASHNPAEYNGFKIAFDDTGNACGKQIYNFYDYTVSLKFKHGLGKRISYNPFPRYLELLKSSVIINKNLNVVIDPGNGTTSLFIKSIMNMFPVNVTYINEDSDGRFPNHIPDPAVEENMEELKNKVVELGADVGLSFDGDGDRIGIVSNTGKFITADKYMIMMIRQIFSEFSNHKVLGDVKCSKSLPDEVSKLGGEYVCYRVGNSYTKRATRELDCIFGGELSGHIYFRDKFPGFDSGIYAGLRMLEALSKSGKTVDELLEGINEYHSTPEIKISCSDDKKFDVVNKVLEYAKEKNYNINAIDGVRVEFSDGWALVRPSNTGPNITERFEGLTKERVTELKEEFESVINKYL